MSAGSIISRKLTELITAQEHDVFLSLAERLERRNIGVLIVMDLANRLLGIVSERDLVRAIARHSAGAFALTAQDVMTRKVVVCSPDETETQVMVKMIDKGIRHMPVVDAGRVVGLVSMRDLVQQRLKKLGLRLGDSTVAPTLESMVGSFSRHLSGQRR